MQSLKKIHAWAQMQVPLLTFYSFDLHCSRGISGIKMGVNVVCSLLLTGKHDCSFIFVC